MTRAHLFIAVFFGACALTGCGGIDPMAATEGQSLTTECRQVCSEACANGSSCQTNANGCVSCRATLQLCSALRIAGKTYVHNPDGGCDIVL